MHEYGIIDLVIFIAAFLGGSVLIHRFTKHFSFPYTITIFAIGLILQLLQETLPFPLHFTLSIEVIFFLLIPLLLFESALHIKFHHFRLQFKTISFMATFGLLFSVFTIGILLPLLVGLPLEASLLFGAIISATDTAAVIALFKTLRVPKRLELLVDGESMFNDGTAVIVFKLISTFVLGGIAISPIKIFGSFGDFIYVFFGAIILGVFLGYITSQMIGKIENDKIAQTTLTIALALGSFILAEHFFHVSGFITTVLAGITLGNLGLVRFSNKVREFNEEVWEYIAFLANSVVFFFMGFIFHFAPFAEKPIFYLLAIFVVLVARAFATYLSFGLTNMLPLFKNEPNVPFPWQHLINWGAIRGTIPLVLVFTIPESYQYREELVNITMATILFTMIVNGTTLEWLLKKLRLHIPEKDEEIIQHELSLFHEEENRMKLEEFEKNEFDYDLIDAEKKKLVIRTESEIKEILNIADPEAFGKSLKRYAITVERHKLEDLLTQDSIDEAAFFEFDTELDLQEDALDFADTSDLRGIDAQGLINNSTSYRKRLLAARRIAAKYPVFSRILKISEEELILTRYQILKARILASEDVFVYFTQVKELIKKPQLNKKVDEIIRIHSEHVKSNLKQLKEIEEKYPHLVKEYQIRVVEKAMAH